MVDKFKALAEESRLRILALLLDEELCVCEIEQSLGMTQSMEHIEDDLGKYGILHLRFLHERKHEMYTELLFSGKLAEHCASIDIAAFEQIECIRADYLDKHPMPSENTMDRIRISTQAQMVADEIVMAELIYR